MKIYKGNVGFELTVDAFLDLLEEDAIDDLIQAVLDLEATPVQNDNRYRSVGDFDGDHETDSVYFKDGDTVYVGEVNLDDYDDDMDGLFEHISGNLQHMEAMSMEDFENVFGPGGFEGACEAAEELDDAMVPSNEDLRIRRVVTRFRHINEAL